MRTAAQSVAPVDTKAIAKMLGKTLSRVRSLTTGIVVRAEYDGSSAGRSRNAYQRSRGVIRNRRDVEKLERLLQRAQELSPSLGTSFHNTTLELSAVTRAIVRHCEFFPRNSEWAGEPLIRKRNHLLSDAQETIRWFAKVK